VVPGLGLGFGLGFASSDIAVEDGLQDLVRVRRICSVLAAHEDCLPFCIYEGGSSQTSPPQTSINTQSVRSCLLFPFLVQYFARFTKEKAECMTDWFYPLEHRSRVVCDCPIKFSVRCGWQTL
jgi:hypothetical protein